MLVAGELEENTWLLCPWKKAPTPVEAGTKKTATKKKIAA
jgi:hypothetical protein